MGVVPKLSTARQIFGYENHGRAVEELDELIVSSSDSVFGFSEGSTGSSSDEFDDMFDVEDERGDFVEENKAFWENQHNLLLATLCRTSSLETRIRNVTKQVVRELHQAESNYCKCSKAVTPGTGCRSCLLTEVSGRLCKAGYNAAICWSKWRNSPNIPAGEHTFLDVIDASNSIKGEIRVIIELNFRGEFEMARASVEYNELINQLPEVYVAKIDRLKSIVDILCTSAKKCMKDEQMHLAPWMKQKYMHAKWFSSNCERIVVEAKNVPLNRAHSIQTTKPRKASMLTMALSEAPKSMAVA